MTDRKEMNWKDQPQDEPQKSSAPLTREQILLKLAEVANQKKSARLASESAQKKPSGAGDFSAEETIKVLRTWLVRSAAEEEEQPAAE